MLILIDESGDSGFKFRAGSSTHLVIAMVIFDCFREAERVSAAVAELRRTLRVGEFHFTKNANAVRDAFFETVVPFEFRVCALVVDKRLIVSRHLRQNPKRFYSFCIRQLITGNEATIHNARVKIDKNGNREFTRELRTYLSRQCRDQVQSVKLKDSKGDDLIQLADMVAGAIGRSCKPEATHRDRWRRMLRPRITNIWNFR
ncbi:MAG: DUF3800 domain-containing protein [Alphaproteobacteria bacterium]